jgi:hypothetical protein
MIAMQRILNQLSMQKLLQRMARSRVEPRGRSNMAENGERRNLGRTMIPERIFDEDKMHEPKRTKAYM